VGIWREGGEAHLVALALIVEKDGGMNITEWCANQVETERYASRLVAGSNGRLENPAVHGPAATTLD